MHVHKISNDCRTIKGIESFAIKKQTCLLLNLPCLYSTCIKCNGRGLANKKLIWNVARDRGWAGLRRNTVAEVSSDWSRPPPPQPIERPEMGEGSPRCQFWTFVLQVWWCASPDCWPGPWEIWFLSKSPPAWLQISAEDTRAEWVFVT